MCAGWVTDDDDDDNDDIRSPDSQPRFWVVLPSAASSLTRSPDPPAHRRLVVYPRSVAVSRQPRCCPTLFLLPCLQSALCGNTSERSSRLSDTACRTTTGPTRSRRCLRTPTALAPNRAVGVTCWSCRSRSSDGDQICGDSSLTASTTASRTVRRGSTTPARRSCRVAPCRRRSCRDATHHPPPSPRSADAPPAAKMVRAHRMPPNVGARGRLVSLRRS